MQYYKLHQLSGKGHETLLDAIDGTPLAWFFNGNMVAARPMDYSAQDECNMECESHKAKEGQESETVTHWEAA